MGCDGQTHRAVRRRPRWPRAGPRARASRGAFLRDTRPSMARGLSRYIRGHGSISTREADDTRTCLRDLRERGRRPRTPDRRQRELDRAVTRGVRRATAAVRPPGGDRGPVVDSPRTGRPVGATVRALDRPRRRARADGVLRPTRCAVGRDRPRAVGARVSRRGRPAPGDRRDDRPPGDRALPEGRRGRAAAVVGWEGTPRDAPLASDLEREPMDPVAPPIDELARGRSGDPRLPARRRPPLAGHAAARVVYRRGGNAVGYGYHPSRAAWGGRTPPARPTCRCCWPTATRRRRLRRSCLRDVRHAHDRATRDRPSLGRGFGSIRS